MSTTRQSRTPKRSYVELSSDEDDAAVPQPSRGSSSRSATARRASSKGRAANGNKKEEGMTSATAELELFGPDLYSEE